ncbi:MULTISPECIES: hydroxylamine reductase [Clostridium]|uniref:Hydroxylamine reductase n=3 Tax=Clostridium TaxID=1485 RepID=D8GMZ6_CLOLD|nr:MULTISPECIES: hydroxylamine reductase [Clostridium]ADK15784.1 predicted hybrid cluster protein [Clostridium ljungdahlii DSM 13528]AGY75039.1 hydroxylamine reductase [Clostridium autoethanogenum DSM 10061]ALU35213.1 Hydroxylamine reductase [Clostridium autoethanogenum DSM 10061]OAA86415.1 Hydroxylamine reductase [Clostridium ljungdahlii DSM 13528]OVY49286.1 Hydroxylamine reductase [Clostridium autoethanogenum]
MSMFCYQCQETAGCKGCTKVGVCGKNENVAKAQDLLIYVTKGLAIVSNEGRKVGVKDSNVDKVIVENLFTTITNANFHRDFILGRVKETLKIRENLKSKVISAGGKVGEVKVTGGFFKKIFGIQTTEMIMPDAAVWTADNTIEFDAKAEKVGVLATKNEDIRSLRELITYGLKGLSAYMKHAMNLNYNSEEIHAFMAKALSATIDNSLTVDDLVALSLEAGKFGVDGMALLDKANTESYGHPEITTVDIGVRSNPGILISGHDLKDLEMLLEQTEGTGVDVYTHGEMLAGQYYPKFKKYKHFAGNYGNAWWKQKEEFEKFNGPIIMTTNCLVIPKDTYKNRLFTTGDTGMPGCSHIEVKADGTKDFSKVIKMAKKCSAPTEIEKGQIVGGFAHNQVLALADKVVEAVKSGAIKRFFVMAGCDGRAKSRDYYTEFASKLPKDTVILTAGCAKYKYNKLNLGDIGGIPRILDAGQCNDSYSLVVIALKLQEVFGLKNINELPISYNIAWYEQKAVIVLLSLLHLGVKNIHLGPTLPAFLSANVAKVLVDNFGIGGITDVENDFKKLMEI